MTRIYSNINTDKTTVRIVALSPWGKNMLAPARAQTKVIDKIELIKPKPKARSKKQPNMAEINRMLLRSEGTALERAESSSMRLIGRKHI